MQPDWKTNAEVRIVHAQKLNKVVEAQFFIQVAYNEKVFAMAGYSLIVQPVQMPYWKYFVEDKICSLIINGRVGKGISAQASHKTVLEILTSHGFSHLA